MRHIMWNNTVTILYLIEVSLIQATLYLIQRPPDVDGAVLDDGVHHLGDGRGEVRVAELGMEENLGAQETLIAYVY